MDGSSQHDLTDLEEATLDWAREAAEIARRNFQHTGPLRFKYAQEAVTEADREIERLIGRRIRERFPSDAILGEEYGPSDVPDELPGGRVWHIDPIDGTLNFSLGLPNFCTSIALMDGATILAACVYSPLHREGFTAVKDGGARLNGDRIGVSDRATVAEAIISAQLQKHGRYVQNPELLQAILLQSMKVRRFGTIALEMAYLAGGRYDALVASRGRPVRLHDVAAGILLVREAGGRVTDHAGGEYRPYARDLVASNGLIHEELIGLIRRHDRPIERSDKG